MDNYESIMNLFRTTVEEFNKVKIRLKKIEERLDAYDETIGQVESVIYDETVEAKVCKGTTRVDETITLGKDAFSYSHEPKVPEANCTVPNASIEGILKIREELDQLIQEDMLRLSVDLLGHYTQHSPTPTHS